MDVTSVLYTIFLVSIAVITILLVISFYLATRAMSLYNMPGSFECCWSANSSQEWESGVARYNMNYLSWYRLVGVSRIPELRWYRSSINFDFSKVVFDENGSDKVSIEFSYRDFNFIFLINIRDYEGFISWLESGPPEVKNFY